MAGGFLSMRFGLGLLRKLSFQVAAVSLCTVHAWDARYALIVFLLGSSMECLIATTRSPFPQRTTLIDIGALPTSPPHPLRPWDERSEDELIAPPACPAHVLPVRNVDTPAVDDVE